MIVTVSVILTFWTVALFLNCYIFFMTYMLNSSLYFFYRLMCETVRYERHEANEVLY